MMRVRVPGGYDRPAEMVAGVLYVSGFLMRGAEIAQTGLVLVEATPGEREALRAAGIQLPDAVGKSRL